MNWHRAVLVLYCLGSCCFLAGSVISLWRDLEDRRKDRERREQAAAWVPRPGTRYG